MKYASAVPHSPLLEDVVLPQTEDIIAALRELVRF
jgi:pyruvate/2-oxoglutarate/acetoin dehydrogenase E1 component